MRVFVIAYLIGGKKFEVRMAGFRNAQTQVAQIMDAGGEILGIKEETK